MRLCHWTQPTADCARRQTSSEGLSALANVKSACKSYSTEEDCKNNQGCRLVTHHSCWFSRLVACFAPGKGRTSALLLEASCFSAQCTECQLAGPARFLEGFGRRPTRPTPNSLIKQFAIARVSCDSLAPSRAFFSACRRVFDAMFKSGASSQACKRRDSSLPSMPGGLFCPRVVRAENLGVKENHGSRASQASKAASSAGGLHAARSFCLSRGFLCAGATGTRRHVPPRFGRVVANFGAFESKIRSGSAGVGHRSNPSLREKFLALPGEQCGTRETGETRHIQLLEST